MDVIKVTNTLNKPLKSQRSQNRLLVWIGRTLLGLLIVLALLAVVGASYQAIATARDEIAFPRPGQMIDVGGYKLHINCKGEGSPTVITENGLGGSSPDWSLVQPIVGENTRICSYDRAGSGWSDTGPAPRTSQQIATELHTLLANAGVPGPYVLVGHSAGGMHIQVYASQYPDEVAGLVLVDPTPAQLIESFTAEERQALLPKAGQFRLLSMLQFFGLLRFIPLPGDEALTPLPAATQALIRAHRLQSGAITAMSAEVLSMETSIIQTAEAVSLPPERPFIIVWHGIPAEPVELEPLARASMEELAQRSNNSKLIVAENSGHYITFDRPDVVIEAIRQVVEATRTGTPLVNSQ
jgi:pimeloyl-ACP methyl ester carboxylesterase